MIAKPDMPEAEIRLTIERIDEDFRAGKMELPVTRSFWKEERKRLFAKLDDWQAWRKQERRLRALHQRPSVRRHITRRVKTPA